MPSNYGAGEASESPLDCKEIKPVNPKGKRPLLFTGRTDAEALILWPPDVKSRIIGDDDCSHEVKRYLLLTRKDMTNLDSILNSRDIT